MRLILDPAPADHAALREAARTLRRMAQELDANPRLFLDSLASCDANAGPGRWRLNIDSDAESDVPCCWISRLEED